MELHAAGKPQRCPDCDLKRTIIRQTHSAEIYCPRCDRSENVQILIGR